MAQIVIEYPNCWEGTFAVDRAKREATRTRELLFDVRAGGLSSFPCELLGVVALLGLERAKALGLRPSNLS